MGLDFRYQGRLVTTNSRHDYNAYLFSNGIYFGSLYLYYIK